MGVRRNKKGDRWVIRWLDGGKPPLGIYRQTSFPTVGEDKRPVTYEEARKVLKEKEAEAARRRPGSGPSRLTFKQLAERYLEVHGPKLTPSWRKAVQRILEKHFYPRFGSTRAEHLRAGDVVRYQNLRENEVSGATVNREVAVLMAVLNFGEAEEWIDRNPIPRRRVKPFREQRRTRHFTTDEWRRLTAAFDDPVAWKAHIAKVRRLGPVSEDLATGTKRRHGGGRKPGSDASEAYRLRLRAAVTVFQALLLLGCRRGEALYLRWSDVDKRRGVVRIRLPKTIKRGLPEKTLPLVAGIKELLDAQPSGVGNAWVFPRPVDDHTRDRQPDGEARGPWEDRKLMHAFKLAKELAGLKEPEEAPRASVAVIHTIRHTAETWLARAGFTETLRNAYLGHVDDSMAGTYTHLQPEDLIPLVEKLSEEAGFKGSGDARSDAPKKTPGRARR